MCYTLVTGLQRLIIGQMLLGSIQILDLCGIKRPLSQSHQVGTGSINYQECLAKVLVPQLK